MRPEQLRSLREARGLTREQMAAELGDCTASSVNKWERGMHEIPAWVEDKMLSNVRINFPLSDLHALLDLAREENISFETLLSEAAQLVIRQRREKQQPQTVNHTGPTAKPLAASPSNITPMPPQHIAADAPADNSSLPTAQTVSYGSGKRRKTSR